MYEYLDRFIRTWSDDDLIEVLSKLPEHPVVGSDWSALIAAVGMKSFMHLAMTFPGAEIKIPSMFEILCVFSAEEIMTKIRQGSSREDATKQVLGEVELEEVEALVDRLQTLEESSEAGSATST